MRVGGAIAAAAMSALVLSACTSTVEATALHPTSSSAPTTSTSLPRTDRANSTTLVCGYTYLIGGAAGPGVGPGLEVSRSGALCPPLTPGTGPRSISLFGPGSRPIDVHLTADAWWVRVKPGRYLLSSDCDHRWIQVPAGAPLPCLSG
jgi:hypothetical protein